MRLMRNRFIKHRGTIVMMMITIASFYAIMLALGISCPIKYIFGVSCPGCGMTRATLSALRLDFIGAFYYHPLWLLPLPSLALLAILFVKGKKKIARGVIGVLAVAFLITYFVRLADPSDIIVTFSPENSIIKRAFDFVFN